MKHASLAIGFAATLALASCVATTKTQPLTLVDLDIDGSPRIGPGGPSVYVDGTYRGNPVDGHLVMWMTVGSHYVKLLGGSKELWAGDVEVQRSNDPQDILVRYELDPLAEN